MIYKQYKIASMKPSLQHLLIFGKNVMTTMAISMYHLHRFFTIGIATLTFFPTLTIWQDHNLGTVANMPRAHHLYYLIFLIEFGNNLYPASPSYDFSKFLFSYYSRKGKQSWAIEQKFSRLLWNDMDGSAAKAKVSWRMLCVPKQGGGLGIRKLEEWNHVAMMRHFWSLFVKACSLWVAWVKEILLKGRSFWQIKIPQVCTWSRMKLLELRDEARSFMQFDVGGGQNIHLWFDHWHLAGVL